MVIADFKEKVLRLIDFLPPIPAVMVELIQAVGKDDADLQALGKIISKDPAMSVNVLKVANSAFYGLRGKVNTIEHAVMMLGTKEIASLCIACGAGKTLRPQANTPTLDLAVFWQHSVATGAIAKILCNQLNINTGNNVYLAGLIHDVGKIILDRMMHAVYDAIVALTYAESISVIEAEKRVIGESHDTAGGWLLEKWKLPPIFVEVANYHHSALQATSENRLEVAVVSLANQMARLKSFGFGGDMSGVVLADIDAFKIVEDVHPGIRDLDVVKFIWDLDQAYNEIMEMERLINST
jgi:putative nucleotidyltransferase with HDIG domain